MFVGDGIQCKCGCILPLGPGETCQICGWTAPDAHHVSSVPPAEYKEVAEYWYKSKVELDDNGNGLWKRAHDEGHCLQMSRLNYEVKKVVRKVHVGVRRPVEFPPPVRKEGN